MAENSLASAAAISEIEHAPSSPESSRKRRQSPVSHNGPENESKRRRMSNEKNDHVPAERDSIPKSGGGPSASGKPDREEERKRGRRLFGSVLGTLSQSSTSATQRRRADIEKKQLDKLRSQDEEYAEDKKRRKEELMATRMKEQRVYEKQSMERRHSNMLAMAHSLKTKAEPILYYKPWQLRPDEKSRIQSQLEEARSTIATEVEEFSRRHLPSSPVAHDDPSTTAPAGAPDEEAQPETCEAKDVKAEAKAATETETVGSGTNKIGENAEDSHAHPPPPDTGTNHKPPSNSNVGKPDTKTAEDDAEEVMEDNEDTVIY